MLPQEIQDIIPQKGSVLNELCLMKGKIGCDVNFLITSCIEDYFDGNHQLSLSKAEEVLDYCWEKFNKGHWKDVDIVWRKAYSICSLVKALNICSEMSATGRQGLDAVLQKVLEVCDMGILMGAPILDGILPQIALQLQQLLSAGKSKQSRHVEDPATDSFKGNEESGQPVAKRLKKRHVICPEISPKHLIPKVNCPSIYNFQMNFMEVSRPVILTGVIDKWPAMTSRKWSLEYLNTVAGDRTIPVEIGTKYTEDDWSQRLMPLREFISSFVEPSEIPELRDDIAIPDYCYIKLFSCQSAERKQERDAEETEDVDDDEVDINAWFGPAGTISPLHHDPKHNCLAQVVGEKFIRLYSQDQTSKLYPHQGFLLNNTSQVDVENPDVARFPDFAAAIYQECILQPGELLYIPPKCWHYVKSLSTSFSVSFWWN